MKKSAIARLQTKNRGTSILLLPNKSTMTTTPLPSIASKNTTQTPQRKLHQPKRSSQGMKGPGSGKHWTGCLSCPAFSGPWLTL
ncbi:hypothetical protein X975_25866, partial [Stegodyphus mimosarum]